MALHHSTYLGIPPQRRFAAASNMEKYLREQLADPTLSDERKARVRAKVERLGQWILGTLEVVDPNTRNPGGSPGEGAPESGPGGPKKPKKHDVEINEVVVVEES